MWQLSTTEINNMAQITFYTKPGCMTAAKQIDLLEQSGHEVDVRDLLSHHWTADELAAYFGGLPVEAWFNEKSPRVKSGEINPAAYDREGAFTLMLADHLLIRRPLMESSGRRICGFDPATIHAWVGLEETVYERSIKEDFAGCSQPAANPHACP
jgi:nitrogenase-associated protein